MPKVLLESVLVRLEKNAKMPNRGVVMLQRQRLSQVSCPIKLKVCHALCYWNKKCKCVFPLGGYDKLGQPVAKENSA